MCVSGILNTLADIKRPLSIRLFLEFLFFGTGGEGSRFGELLPLWPFDPHASTYKVAAIKCLLKQEIRAEDVTGM